MITYVNSDERYGNGEIVTIDDYRHLNPDGDFHQDHDGIYECVYQWGTSLFNRADAAEYVSEQDDELTDDEIEGILDAHEVRRYRVAVAYNSDQDDSQFEDTPERAAEDVKTDWIIQSGIAALNEVMTPAEIEREYNLAHGVVRNELVRLADRMPHRRPDERTILIPRAWAEWRWRGRKNS